MCTTTADADDASSLVVKIIDFGIAKSLSAGDNLVQTTTGSAPGTRLYMNADALQGITDVRNDLWALGITMLECALGGSSNVPPRVAFTAPVPVEEMRQRGYSQGFIRVVDKVLSKDPAQGYQTAAEMIQAMADLVRASTGLTSKIMRMSAKPVSYTHLTLPTKA